MLATTDSEGLAPPCAVCGANAYEHVPVLWRELIEEWQLSPEEVRYIDVQQGTRCVQCGCNVRSIVLAKALMSAMSVTGTLVDIAEGPIRLHLRILEINQAGSLTTYLRRTGGHLLVEYPEYDIMDLGLPSSSFDLVVHSDTLEHVLDPVKALKECRRVLKPGGALVFSVPIVLSRLTRSRDGMPPSYHGSPGLSDEALRVHTEFGADAWVMVFRAGFARCELVSFMFPSGLAMLAR